MSAIKPSQIFKSNAQLALVRPANSSPNPLNSQLICNWLAEINTSDRTNRSGHVDSRFTYDSVKFPTAIRNQSQSLFERVKPFHDLVAKLDKVETQVTNPGKVQAKYEEELKDSNHRKKILIITGIICAVALAVLLVPLIKVLPLIFSATAVSVATIYGAAFATAGSVAAAVGLIATSILAACDWPKTPAKPMSQDEAFIERATLQAELKDLVRSRADEFADLDAEVTKLFAAVEEEAGMLKEMSHEEFWRTNNLDIPNNLASLWNDGVIKDWKLDAVKKYWVELSTEVRHYVAVNDRNAALEREEIDA